MEVRIHTAHRTNVYKDVESLLPATRAFPQWTVYMAVENDEQQVMFFNADNITCVEMIGPREEESSEEEPKEGTVISLVKDRGDES